MADQDIHLIPGLYIIATPIGNMGDITLRALETLRRTDAIACEDTRQAGKLAAAYGISAPRLPYHDHNAAEMRPKILAMIAGGKSVALVSDAGMPLISDPGYKLVEACVAEDFYVTCVPGASASLTGLVLSALPSDRFYFGGFLPPKSGARKNHLATLKSIPSTMVFYETAPRLAASLADMAETLGNRSAAVARELTKKFEEIRRGTLADLAAHYAEEGEPKGEIVVIVGAAPETDAAALYDAGAVDRLITEVLTQRGLRLKDAAAAVAAETGLRKNDVYRRALRVKNEMAGGDGEG